MGKVIILEGPDGGGKTILAEFLKQNDFVYKHEGPPPSDRDQVEHYKVLLYDALESKHNVVFDRLYMGECIYGPVIREVDKLGGINGLKLFERILASKQVHQYICLPSERTLKNNYLRKMEDPSDYVGGMSNFRRIINLYYSMLLRPFNKAYDYEVDSPQSVLDEPFDRPLPKGTIGNKHAKYLFIGDIPNHPCVDWPFFALTNSSGYFNKALELAGIEEKDVALSNAYDNNMEPHDPLEICNSFFKLEQIILMGAKAHQWFTKGVGSSKIPIRFIQHPAYLNRFRGHNPEIMAAEIRREIQWQS